MKFDHTSRHRGIGFEDTKMKLVAIAALIAVCGAAKLDRTYLPPSSAATAGGSSESLQTPLIKTSEQLNTDSSGPLPTGSYANNFEGVVVDAAGAGTRASPEGDLSGLGGPRDSYGSENSKVGDAAFRGSVAGFRTAPFGFNGQAVHNGHFVGSNTHNDGIGQNFGAIENKSERPQAFKDRNSNIISYANDVSLDNYSYGFETDNGIAVGENGVAKDGIQAQGGYSYKGDDGQVYKVTYVADEGGYRPQGAHLPTPPPIPKEILESLEQNAKEEAAGLVDDGSYDPQKYNTEGDYTHHNSGNIQYNGSQLPQVAKRPGSGATASNTVINQNQAFSKPGQFGNAVQNSQPNSNGQSNYNSQSNQFTSNFGANQIGFNGPQKESSQTLNGQQADSGYTYGQSSGSQYGQSQFAFGQSQSSQFSAQNNQQAPVTQLTSQTTQQLKPQFDQFSYGSQLNQQSELSQGPAQSGSAFGTQPNKPTFSSNSIYTQQSQFGNQAYKPQTTSGSEYLPPLNSNNRPSYKPQTNGNFPSQNADNNQASNIVPVGQNQETSTGHSPSGSSFASTNQVGYKPQSTQSFNSFQSQPYRPNQFNYNNGQFQSNGQLSPSQTNGSPVSVISGTVKPTPIPSIELTTPLESNEKSPSSQNTQYNSETTPNVGHSLSNQVQPQVGFQTNEVDSRPQGSTQFDSSSPAPTVIPTTLQPNEVKPLPQQNFVGQNQQNNGYYSTSKPSFSQGPDDSYYYNQPSKPFGTPTRPQGTQFSSTPSFQSNGAIPSQNNQYFSQQSSQFPSSIAPVSPTSPSQVTQAQSSFSTNYNGITQAEISPFPSISPTSATQYDTTQTDRFSSKPNVPSFPSNPITTFGQNPSNTFSQNQNKIPQISSSNNGQAAGQSFSSRPTSFGQTTSTFTGNQYTQSSTNNDQPQNSEISQGQMTLTQQYNGTLYEYNKPPEVLPASEESDSSSSQTTHTDVSPKPESQESDKQDMKPQFGTQQTTFGQSSFTSQSQQPSLNNKDQYGSQNYQPFGNSPSGTSQFGQNTQSTFSQQNQGLHAGQGNKPNVPSFTTTSQFVQSGPSFGSKPQFGSQPAKPLVSVPGTSQYGQNTQQQTQGAQYGVQNYKPFGSQSTTLSGQNTQTTFGTTQNSKPQFNDQSNTPFGNKPTTQFGQTFGNTELSQTAQPAKPFGVNSQGQQGYPSFKPPVGSQLHFPSDFVQGNNQQSFGSSQSSSQSASGANIDRPQIHGSPESLKPHFGSQNQHSVQQSSFSQQSYQSNQFGQSTKPQYGVQSQYGQNQHAGVNPFGSASSQAQVGPNAVQVSSFTMSQPSAVQSFKPFETLSPSFQSQNKPQFDQASQTSQGVSSTISPPQFNAQSFGNSQSQEPNKPKPTCCKATPGSAIAPLNVGKPSQAFAQTQSQFTGFQGAQGSNVQSLSGKGEQFGGPRQPPSFDAQTGYHY